jgi:hypothetical protein
MSSGPSELELTFRSVLVSLDEKSPSEPSSLLCVADLVGWASHGPFVASMEPEGAGGDVPSVCASGFCTLHWSCLSAVVSVVVSAVVSVGNFVVGFDVEKMIVDVIHADGDFGVGTLRIDVAVSQSDEREVVRPEVGYVAVHGGARGVGVTRLTVFVVLLNDDTQSAL